MVTHYDVDRAGIEAALEAMREILAAARTQKVAG
jgi:hypothetical protein